MTTDLWMLVAAVALQWVLIMAAAGPNMFGKGILWAVSARDQDVKADLPSWHPRVERASKNLQENLPLFAALVLVVHVAGEHDALSALGAEIFVAARVVHALTYAAGIPWVRTLAWSVSIAGMGLVVAALA